jgi:hypothetical protein
MELFIEFDAPAEDLRRRSWRPAAGRIGFSVVGQDLLQPHHAEFGGDPGALVGNKRGIYAKMTWRNTGN